MKRNCLILSKSLLGTFLKHPKDFFIHLQGRNDAKGGILLLNMTRKNITHKAGSDRLDYGIIIDGVDPQIFDRQLVKFVIRALLHMFPYLIIDSFVGVLNVL